ncbi:Phosphonate-transporting ATPase [[Leptolyngbya] sp. PCC 7376]|uniref:ABC transporter ATP-binding protein n=1 Tax=[Leptolyngbya] sp. PCC 7376 TaxID=111781 RepID=UPI00029F4346|nr:ATP-binding cassette domain-containing protein [[Leptolyngbya] sp. PCC 7376]AFY40059.1 Phosphonate-transporting ATPase [[Leptolyngbya] sp. PCC 7376]
MAVLKVQNLTFQVPARTILQDISFELNEGDRLVLLGSSGSGKSTVLQMLNRLQSPTSGQLTFLDKPYAEYSPEELRQQINLVPQEAKLLGMQVKEVLLYPLTLQKLPKAEIQRRYLYWQEKLDIPEIWLDRNEALLSGGQKQWVAIARGLMLEPKILLLDEPTSALDIGRSKNLAETLLEYQAETKVPIIAATHELDFAKHLATHVIYLEKGRIITDATNADIDWKDLRERLLDVEKNSQADAW